MKRIYSNMAGEQSQENLWSQLSYNDGQLQSAQLQYYNVGYDVPPLGLLIPVRSQSEVTART
jgi:hypothetical protein